MKKLALILSVFLLSAVSMKAQSGFGIKAGMNFNSMSDLEFKDFKRSIDRKTGFHAGILYKWNLPLGLGIQPELLYVQKGGTIAEIHTESSATSNVYASGNIKMHSLQLPVNIQWGLNLVLFKPFVMVSPYLSYQISNETNIKGMKWDTEKFGYGVGLGAGLDLWKFQVSGKYNWDLGKVSEFKWDGADTFKGGKNKGFELSLAFIF
ncbi:MAG: PorT family protein [Bacteroidales bacterium]|nr:PorT family protein [Bacteroidales bacterium]